MVKERKSRRNKWKRKDLGGKLADKRLKVGSKESAVIVSGNQFRV